MDGSSVARQPTGRLLGSSAEAGAAPVRDRPTDIHARQLRAKNGLRGGVELPKRFWCRKVFVRRRQGRYLVNVDGKDGAGFGAKSVCHKGPTNHLAAAAARLNAAVSRVSRAVFSPDGPCWMSVQRRAHYGRLSISSPAICAISARVRLVRQEAADEIPMMTAQPMAAPWVVEV